MGLSACLKPQACSLCVGGGNQLCCQAASLPAFQSLKNNFYRVSHLISMAETPAGLTASLDPRRWGLHEQISLPPAAHSRTLLLSTPCPSPSTKEGRE